MNKLVTHVTLFRVLFRPETDAFDDQKSTSSQDSTFVSDRQLMKTRCFMLHLALLRSFGGKQIFSCEMAACLQTTACNDAALLQMTRLWYRQRPRSCGSRSNGLLLGEDHSLRLTKAGATTNTNASNTACPSEHDSQLEESGGIDAIGDSRILLPMKIHLNC